MSRERYDWLERKGVTDVCNYDYLKQTPRHVYLIRHDIGLVINRKKDLVGEIF